MTLSVNVRTGLYHGDRHLQAQVMHPIAVCAACLLLLLTLGYMAAAAQV